MFDNKPNRHLSPYHRRLLCEALEAGTLLSVGPPQAAVGQAVQAGSGPQQQTLADLPIAAQHSISSAIGQDQSAYHATSGALGVTLANLANGFTARLQSGALQVSAGSDTWDMSLVGLSYGGAVKPVATAKTSTNGNRVDCSYGTIDEWYVNGPSGLEQGFTVAAPQSNASGSLTVELALGGDLVGTVNAAGDGLTLAQADGSAALGYTGLTAYDATGKTLPASLEVRVDGGHQELLIHVDDAGAQGPITIDPFVQEAKLTASNGKAGDNFGCSVSISGNTLVVGAFYAPNTPFTDIHGPGAAYVFTESGSVWTQTAELTASDGAAGDWFGRSVSISGNTVVVGAYEATVGGNQDQGAAYVFAEPASGWADMTQTAKLIASDGTAYSEFGGSISISGNTVVVGAETGLGAAYVFAEPASGWADMTQTAELTASDAVSGDFFGTSVSISGNTVVVGATRPRAVYVFTEPVSGWADMTQTAELTASDGAVGDGFGRSVSISGNTVVVGAPQGGIDGPGAAYVFTEPASGWADMTQTAELTASGGVVGDQFGWSVSTSGNTVVVGANLAAVGGNQYQGAAYVFTEPATGWADMTQTAKLTASDGKTNDSFGESVAISGNTAVVGAPGALGSAITSFPGAAYVFTTTSTLTVNTTDWTSAGLTLTLASDGDLHVYTTGTTTDAVPPVAPASVSSIDITSPSDTTANLTIDSTSGDPIPAGGLAYGGAGGLIITGPGSVTLSGTNTYTGGTSVSSGTLVVTSSSALPGGTSLTVAAGGTFTFDPSVAAANVTAAASIVRSANSAGVISGTTADTSGNLPVSAAARVWSSAATTHPDSLTNPATNPNSGTSADAALLQPLGRQDVDVVIARQYARDLAWLAAGASSSRSGEQGQTKDHAIQALDALLAQYGV